MKNKLIYTIALSLSLLLASCNDWLDVTPPSQIREEQQFSTVEGFQQALIGCYIGMTNDTLYGRVLSWGTIELMAGQFNPLEQYSSNDYYISNFNYTSDNALKYINSLWTKAYNSISNANNILKYAETNKSVLDNINYSIIKGEALAIRAYLHFDIMRLYGHGNLGQRRDLISRATIPYVTSLSKELTPQQPYGTTIANIIADLEEALQLLQIDPVTKLHDAAYYNGVNIDGFFNNRQQRFNYYAASLLLARVYMWEGSSESIGKARTLALKVINETQEKGMVNWVTSSSVNNDMIMKAEHLMSLNTQNLFAKTAKYFMLEIKSVGDIQAQYVTGANIDAIYETATVGATDFRFTNQFIQNSMVVGGRNSYTPLKFYGSVANSPTSVSNNYIPLMRLPEAYYIAVECYIRQSSPDIGQAIELLNTVRAKRGVTQPLTSTTAEQVMEELVKEYRKEFYTEGQMFFLYKRLGMETIPNYNGTAGDQIYLLPYPSVEIQMGRQQ